MRVVLSGALLALASPVAAQTTTPAPAATQAPEKKICRSIQTTGSILGGKRECHTKAEWAAIAEQANADRAKRSTDDRARSGVSLGQ